MLFGIYSEGLKTCGGYSSFTYSWQNFGGKKQDVIQWVTGQTLKYTNNGILFSDKKHY
jgi:hypothetical protein